MSLCGCSCCCCRYLSRRYDMQIATQAQFSLKFENLISMSNLLPHFQISLFPVSLHSGQHSRCKPKRLTPQQQTNCSVSTFQNSQPLPQLHHKKKLKPNEATIFFKHLLFYKNVKKTRFFSFLCIFLFQYYCKTLLKTVRKKFFL